MKIKILKLEFVLLFFIILIGCDEYIRTEVKKNIFVNISSISSFVGNQFQLIASPTDGTYQYIWSSEETDIATVDNNGLVKLVGVGTTNIVLTGGDISLNVPVTSVIRRPLINVSFRTPSAIDVISVSLKAGKSIDVYVTYIPDNANDIPKDTWHSENPNVAIVNEVGRITGVSLGEAKIIYTIGDIVREITVTVS